MTISNLIEGRFRGVSPDALLLASDFDGTLAEIVPRPASASALPENINALERLVTRVLRVVVISGRPTAALRDLVPVAGVLLLGDYGLGEPDTDERLALARFNAEVGRLVSQWSGVRVEPKPGSTSVHYRAEPSAGEEVMRAVAQVAERYGLRARVGRMVVEVTPTRARKEIALGRLIEELGPRAVVYSGDDTGDRGCFEILVGLALPHLAIGVASPEADRELFAACDLVVDGPRELAPILSRIADWAEADRRSG